MFLNPLSPAARFLVCFGLTVPSLLVTVACLFTFQDQGGMDRAIGWAGHALEVEELVHQLVVDVHEIDAAQRAYLFTGRATHRQAFSVSEAKVPADLMTLRDATAADATQRQLFCDLEAHVIDRSALGQQIIELKRTGKHDAAHQMARTDRSKDDMDCIQAVAEAMCQREAFLLAHQDNEVSVLRQSHARWLYGLLLLNLSSLACTMFLLHRLGKAQSLARVCAWSKRIEHQGQWLSFEEYLSRRFRIDATHTISPAELDKLMTGLMEEPGTFSLPARQSQLQAVQ